MGNTTRPGGATGGDEVRVEFEGGGLFSYEAFMKRDETLVSIVGKGVPELRLGQVVRLRGDARGYVPGGFAHEEMARITRFREPFVDGSADHVIRVASADNESWVKPSNIERPEP